MDAKNHWERVYAAKAPESVSWYAPHLQESLAYIKRTGFATTASVIDVGGGEATLVDDLLEAGYSDVRVLDLSAKAPGSLSREAGRQGRSSDLAGRRRPDP